MDFLKYKSISLISCLVLLLMILPPYKGHGCLNEYRARLDGRVIYTDGEYTGPGPRFNIEDKALVAKKLHWADSIYQQTHRLEDYSDYGTMLVYAGEYLRAKQLFQEIEHTQPGRYQTAANIGTIYELLGQNDSALYWIKKAVAINPDSHDGSEWIHVKILEAKIKANGSEEYLRTHSILELDFGNDIIPQNKTGKDLWELRGQLNEQLNERMMFIHPKDAIMAQLLFDLGNMNAITLHVKSGIETFNTAEKYGYSSDLFVKRKAWFEKLQWRADIRNDSRNWIKRNRALSVAIVLTMMIALITGVTMWVKRRQRRRQQTNTP